MKTTIETKTGNFDHEVLFYSENGEDGREPKTIAELKEAIKIDLEILQDNIVSDLESLWKRMDKLEKK